MNLEGLTFDDVLLRPQKGVLSSRADADVSSYGLSIPLIAAPMPSLACSALITEITRLGGMGVVHRMDRTSREVLDAWYNAHQFGSVAIGLSVGDFEFLYEHEVRHFTMDVAHAHSERALRFVRYVKTFDDVHLIAGSVATYEGCYDLIEHGADALRIGIGPGSVCTTRSVTGFGVPQLDAIQQAARATGGTIPVIADGGIRGSGDIIKCLAAGADAVMIGSLFARSIEANSVFHYGNASARVNGHRAPEGIEVEISSEEREPLENIVKRLVWGIKSGISYAGATNIEELYENAEWIKLTDAGRKESKL